MDKRIGRDGRFSFEVFSDDAQQCMNLYEFLALHMRYTVAIHIRNFTIMSWCNDAGEYVAVRVGRISVNVVST